MMALLVIVALFAACWLLGLAVLSLVRADLASLRVALTTPLVGSATAVLPLFLVSYAGIPMSTGSRPVLITLLVLAAIVVAVRRPRLPRTLLPVLGVSLAGMLLAAWPVFRFDLHWLAEGNDDMANYVLSATYLLHHGLLAPIDYVGLSHDRDYASVLAALHRAGSRPGADITLSAVSALTGLRPQELFMPLIYAFGMGMTCGAAALAMQASRKWWAASVAAALVAVSPQATYGILVQLMPQVWGLGLAAALCALVMRRELHRDAGPALRDIVPIGLLVAAILLVYVELASTLVLGYLIYVAILAVRRELDLRVAIRLWAPALAFAAVVLNGYLIKEISYVRSQASVGIHGLYAGPPNWGYTLMPGSLAGIVGFYRIPVNASTAFLQEGIIIAALLLVGVVVGIFVTARRGVAASAMLIGYLALGIYLGIESSDFGLFKLYMYVQPFLAAAVAVWLAGVRRRWVLPALALPLIVLVGVQIAAQQKYVKESRNPLALRDASSESLLPTFNRIAAGVSGPLITVTENPALGKLEAANMGERPLYFMSQFFFGPRSSPAAQANGWQARRFAFPQPSTHHVDVFWENTHTAAVLARGECTIVLPTGTQIPVNRSALPAREGEDIVAQPCADVRNKLVFTASTLGWGFFAFSARNAVSFYPPEGDSFFAGRTYAAFGRYALFRVLQPARQVRVELALTTTNLQKALPPASVLGAARTKFPLVGIGSGRVFSAPVQMQMIGGSPYVLLDLGRNGALPRDQRPGLEGVYGRSVPLDPRYLTAFVRNVSLVSEREYEQLRRPTSLSAFPAALENPNLEYSGVEENGFVGRDSYVVLAGGKAADLVVRAGVLAAPSGQRVQMIVNGKEVAARAVAAGPLSLRVHLPASSAPRRIELHWRFAPRLPAPDNRTVAAILQYVGVVPTGSLGVTYAPRAIQHFPDDLRHSSLVYAGIYLDGWLARESSVVLAGGHAADLVVRATVPPPASGQRLRVLVDGREVATRAVPPGELELRVPIPASSRPREIELRWASAPRLPAPDIRHAAARLEFLGISPRR